MDLCVSTGKQPNLRDYFDRPANWGRDERDGATALLLAAEMLEYERGWQPAGRIHLSLIESNGQTIH